MLKRLPIVLAVGSTRNWRSSFYGVGAALTLLALVIAALGPALTQRAQTWWSCSRRPLR